MVKICPVSVKRINENLSRLNAGFTVALVVLFLTTRFPSVLMVIVADFFLRNIMEGKFNPIIRFNKYLIQAIGIPNHMINAGPKIFAARVGLFLSVLSAAFYISGNISMTLFFLGILGFFALLESAINFCVACKLYPFVLPLNKYFEKG